MINYENLINLIAKQFKQIDDNFVFCNEQAFLNGIEIDENKMYVVISFGSTSVNLNKAELPISITIVAQENEIDRTQNILDKYSYTFNNTNLDGYIPQFYTTADIQENFLQVGNGFRSAYAIEGLLLVAEFITTNKVKFKYGDGENDYEEFDIIAYNDNAEASLNPQDYPDCNKIKSYGTFQTLTFSITGYPKKNSELIKKLFTWKWDSTTNHANDIFLFSPVFNGIDDLNIGYLEFKCLGFTYSSVIEEFPSFTASFSL